MIHWYNNQLSIIIIISYLKVLILHSHRDFFFKKTTNFLYNTYYNIDNLAFGRPPSLEYLYPHINGNAVCCRERSKISLLNCDIPLSNGLVIDVTPGRFKVLSLLWQVKWGVEGAWGHCLSNELSRGGVPSAVCLSTCPLIIEPWACGGVWRVTDNLCALIDRWANCDFFP